MQSTRSRLLFTSIATIALCTTTMAAEPATIPAPADVEGVPPEIMEMPSPDVPTSDKPFSHWLGARTPTELLRVMPGATPANLRYASEYIDQFEVIGDSPTEIPSGTQTTLRETLGSNSGFGALQPDRCKFRPGLSFRTGDGGDQVDFLVCFACDEIGIVPRGKELIAVYTFDQATRDILLKTAKALLPDDGAIQDLPPVRRDRTAPPPPAPSLPDPPQDS